MLKLPSKFLQQHGSKIRDGLAVLKLVASLGRCAGLPLDLQGMPTEVVSMARSACTGSGPARRLDEARLHGGVSHLSPLAARASPDPHPAMPLAPCGLLASMRAARLIIAHCTLHSARTGGGPSRQDVRSVARQRRLSRGAGHLAKPRGRALLQVLQDLQVLRDIAHCGGHGQGLPRAQRASASPLLPLRAAHHMEWPHSQP